MTEGELKKAMDEVLGEGAGERMFTQDVSEQQLIDALGRRMGWGRIMQLSEQCWREHLARTGPGLEGGEHSTGPCVSMLVPCPCIAADDADCAWCCGAGRVTKRVAQAMIAQWNARRSS